MKRGESRTKKKHTRSSNETTTLTPSQSNENKQTLWENSREWKNYMIFPFHHFYFNCKPSMLFHPIHIWCMNIRLRIWVMRFARVFFLLYPTPIFNVCRERLFRFYVPTVVMVAMLVWTVLVLLYVVSIWISICVCIRIVVSFANPATVSAAILFFCST